MNKVTENRLAKNKELLGKKFGSLTVIELIKEKDKHGYFQCNCKCDCGNEIITTISRVKQGRATSCGCSRKGVRDFEDLTGIKFGKLTAVKRGTFEPGRTYWVCKCDCGNEIEVRADNLKNGSSQSCGCLSKETHLDLTDKRFGRLKAIRKVGTCDKNNCLWECRCDCGKIGVYTATRLNALITTSCGCKSAEHIKNVQHIGASTGRYEGTKIGSISRSDKPNKNSTTGIKGVYWIERDQVWRSSIGFQNKNIYLGTFKDKKEAIKARKEAEEQYFKPIIEEYKNGGQINE